MQKMWIWKSFSQKVYIVVSIQNIPDNLMKKTDVYSKIYSFMNLP